MTQFYIQYTPRESSEPEFYALTCTSGLEVRYTGRATMNPVESRATISDHYIKENMTVTFDGLITDIKNISLPEEQQRSVQQNIEKLEMLWQTGEPFIVYWREGNIPYTDFVFSSLTLRKQSGSGSAYLANFQMTQIQRSRQANLVTIEDQTPPVKDKHGGVTPAGGNSVKQSGTGFFSWLTDSPTFTVLGFRTARDLLNNSQEPQGGQGGTSN